MKTEVKKIDGTKREVGIEVNGDIVKNKFDEVFQRIGQEAKVAGFRPGHVPRDILEKHYSSQAHQQVLKELIPEAYNQAIDKEALEVIDLPNIADVKLDRNTLSFKATVEILPELNIKNYKGFRVYYKKIEVTQDEIKHQIDSLKETRKADTIDDKFARGLGYPDLAEFQKAIERQIFIEKENLQRQRIEKEMVEGIIKDLDFKIPRSLIDRQLKELVKQAKVEMALKGTPREDIDKQEKSLFSELEPEAKKQVKIYLSLAQIAKRENIVQDDHMPNRVMEFLLKEADWKENP